MTSEQYEEEQYELVENNELLKGKESVYQEKSSIGTKLCISYSAADNYIHKDWLHEESVERIRLHGLRSARGTRGLLFSAFDSSRTWFILILTGIGIGIIGAWLDVLVQWYCEPLSLYKVQIGTHMSVRKVKRLKRR